MLKIFMTGDNHIGLKYASHERASILAATRMGAFRNMVQAANTEECDLFMITGDLFENTYGNTKKDIKDLVGTLSEFHGAVAVLPGNHDYYDKDVKVWQDFRDIVSGKDNIVLMSEYRPYELDVHGKGVVLYPALCQSKHSAPGENKLGWIKDEDIKADNVYRIGIAHGAVEGETIDSEGKYFLMTRQELESIPVDAWLIGHTHVPFPSNLSEDAYTAGERIFNAGTHVQTDVSCNTEGWCFILEIDSGEGVKPVRAKKYRSSNLHFYRRTIKLTAGEMEDALQRALEDIADMSVVDVILTGAVTAEEYDDRNKLLEDILSRFVEGTYSDSGMSVLISKELINAEFPETSFSAGFLTALLDEPKEAQLTYELLKSLKEGK
ncbi:MAG: metallophosphoesterase [Lachnospiraceae bacterium]|nr:metallophosphoesterase [Lachnospiraceae bacterium]